MEEEIRETMLTVNGIRLHVVQAGPETGHPILLLHGFPEYWRGWEKQILPLAQAGYRVIVPDQRGYNLSDKPEDLCAYRTDVLAADAVELMGALGYEKFILVGHDWGGVVSWVVATLYPDRVEKLAILNAPYPRLTLGMFLRNPAQLLRSAYIGFFQLPVLPEKMLLANNAERLVRMMRQSSNPGSFTEEDFQQYCQAWQQPRAMTCMLNWYRALLRKPFALPSSPRFDMPVRIIWGAQDIALGKDLAYRSASYCTNVRLEMVEGATHWIQHDEPELVNSIILELCAAP